MAFPIAHSFIDRIGSAHVRQDSKGRPLFFDQFQGISKRHHVIGLGMQNDRAELDGACRPKSFPGRAEKDKRRRTRVDVHGDGSTPTRSDYNIGMVPVELGLGNENGFVEILIGQSRIQDLVAVVLEIGRLDAACYRLASRGGKGWSWDFVAEFFRFGEVGFGFGFVAFLLVCRATVGIRLSHSLDRAVSPPCSRRWPSYTRPGRCERRHDQGTQKHLSDRTEWPR